MGAKSQKPLTEALARKCEEAGGPTCRCRCKGALHGVARGGIGVARSFYEGLPEADPHHLYTAEEVERMKRERLEERRREHQEAMERRWKLRAESEARTFEISW